MEDFFNKFIKKDKIENYYPTTVLLNKTNLKKYLRYLKKTVKVEENFGQTKLTENKSKFSLLFCRFPDKGKKFSFFILRKHK